MLASGDALRYAPAAMARGRRYWLMKSEPDAYALADLERAGVGSWDGVRNYQARNHLCEMKVGDLVLFYHSNATPPGVVGLARVCREAYPDHTAWNPKSTYYDAKSDPAAPRWFMVDVEYVETFPRQVTLDDMRCDPELADMLVIRRGQRLSVQPVERAHFARVLRLGGAQTRVRSA